MFKRILQSFIFISIFLFGSTQAEQFSPLLTLNMRDEAILPRNFRTVQDPYKISEAPLPSRKGLDSLNMSGSAQFSEKSLQVILENTPPAQHFYVIDLRQESHGYLNGTAVCWYGMRDWANVGKTFKKIKKEEKELLKSTLKQKDVIVHKIIDKDIEDHETYDTVSIPLSVRKVATEEELIKAYNLHYYRLPLTDHVPPAHHQVDRFVEFIRNLPTDAWIHFHCSAGVGRTTTFMVMYDMMKNAKKVSFDDIVKRQWYIGGRNLFKISHRPWSKSFTIDRVQFLKEFYDYCRNNNDQFMTSWSLYALQNS